MHCSLVVHRFEKFGYGGSQCLGKTQSFNVISELLCDSLRFSVGKAEMVTIRFRRKDIK
jgi:hypothetical protein